MHVHTYACSLLYCFFFDLFFFFFFFNDTATTEIYTLSLHDALPISDTRPAARAGSGGHAGRTQLRPDARPWRSEEHTSELQSRLHLVCRLLLEKKKKKKKQNYNCTHKMLLHYI